MDRLHYIQSCRRSGKCPGHNNLLVFIDYFVLLGYSVYLMELL